MTDQEKPKKIDEGAWIYRGFGIRRLKHAAIFSAHAYSGGAHIIFKPDGYDVSYKDQADWHNGPEGKQICYGGSSLREAIEEIDQWHLRIEQWKRVKEKEAEYKARELLARQQLSNSPELRGFIDRCSRMALQVKAEAQEAKLQADHACTAAVAANQSADNAVKIAEDLDKILTRLLLEVSGSKREEDHERK